MGDAQRPMLVPVRQVETEVRAVRQQLDPDQSANIRERIVIKTS